MRFKQTECLPEPFDTLRLAYMYENESVSHAGLVLESLVYLAIMYASLLTKLQRPQ